MLFSKTCQGAKESEPLLAKSHSYIFWKICAEGMVVPERDEAYEFMVRFILDDSPGRDASRVYVLSRDGFFSQEMIRKRGLLCTHFITVHWYLFESTLPKRFSKTICPFISEQLRKMAFAKTEAEVQSTFESTMNILTKLSIRKIGAKNELRRFASEWPTYAVFKLRQVNGNRGLVSSTSAEQNHSSILSHLNEQDRKLVI